MARRPRLLAPGVLYHVIVRGNQRQKNFFDDSESEQAIGVTVREMVERVLSRARGDR
jgi:REP element-mobilizing transposase RayT